VLALIETAGLVDAHLARETGLLRQLLQARMQLAFSISSAGGAGRIRGARVKANEYMMFKSRQENDL
jgi:hypothetical protein